MSQARKHMRRLLLPTTLLLLVLLLAACGGGSSSTGAGTVASASMNAPAQGNNTGASKPSTSAQQGSGGKSAAIITQYLIKTLKVSMAVKDTTRVADDIQNWISTHDPRSTSAGINYDSVGNNLFNISLSFSVQSSVYSQVEHYLRDYAGQHQGQLLGFNESVQDVTNDYVDTQSRLTNLRGEQERLLTLQSKAQALGDIITIQDKLTDVEGQIETIEAHLKALNDQVTFYTVSISLQPTTLTTEPPPQNNAWNVGQVFHDAFAASLGFAQGLATFFIWVLAYSFYIIPLGLIAWGVWRWRTHLQRVIAPASIIPPSPKI